MTAENAELSKAYIDRMMARGEAEAAIAQAQKKLDWAKSVGADKTFPTAYSAGEEALANANSAFEKEDYLSALQYANAVNDALAGVREVTPLPKFYVVRPWAETKDCYWNISGRKYIYNNPLLWENLYQANKSKMPRPNDPNLILPGMKMEIPSIAGELREGTYSSNKEYEPFKITAGFHDKKNRPVWVGFFVKFLVERRYSGAIILIAPKKERVKALSEARLDRSYSG